MNIAQAIDERAPVEVPESLGSPASPVTCRTGFGFRFRQLNRFLGRLIVRLLRGEERSPSILRNNTNLPVFLGIALGISIICNFALKENSAQASRYASPASNLHDLQAMIARNPDDAELHSRLGELYLQQRNFKRAMFHFRESSRLTDLYGE